MSEARQYMKFYIIAGIMDLKMNTMIFLAC